MEFCNCLFTLCTQNAEVTLTIYQVQKCNSSTVIGEMLCVVLCYVAYTFNFECLLNMTVYRTMWITMSWQKLDKVAADNGLNKWILCNLCHFSMIQTSSDEYAKAVMVATKSRRFTFFCEILFVKMKMSKPSYCRSNDDGTSQINVQTHSKAEKFKIIIFVSVCKLIS